MPASFFAPARVYEPLTEQERKESEKNVDVAVSQEERKASEKNVDAMVSQDVAVGGRRQEMSDELLFELWEIMKRGGQTFWQMDRFFRERSLEVYSLGSLGNVPAAVAEQFRDDLDNDRLPEVEMASTEVAQEVDAEKAKRSKKDWKKVIRGVVLSTVASNLLSAQAAAEILAKARGLAAPLTPAPASAQTPPTEVATGSEQLLVESLGRRVVLSFDASTSANERVAIEAGVAGILATLGNLRGEAGVPATSGELPAEGQQEEKRRLNEAAQKVLRRVITSADIDYTFVAEKPFIARLTLGEELGEKLGVLGRTFVDQGGGATTRKEAMHKVAAKVLRAVEAAQNNSRNI